MHINRATVLPLCQYIGQCSPTASVVVNVLIHACMHRGRFFSGVKGIPGVVRSTSICAL